jgi:hypothetical protein
MKIPFKPVTGQPKKTKTPILKSIWIVVEDVKHRKDK